MTLIRKLGPTLLLMLFVLSAFAGIFAVLVSPAVQEVHAVTPTIIRTSLPPKFGVDVGPAEWSFSASKFSFGSGDGSNITIALPSLTTVVAGTGCAVAQSSSFSHTSGASGIYKWTYSGASACNGVALATSMTLEVLNLTTYAYNQREVLVSGSIAKAGSASVTPELLFPLSFLGALSICDTGSACSSVRAGSTMLSWANMGTGDTSLYSNSTKTLTAIAAASTSTAITFSFDPFAVDGSNGCTTSAVSTCTIALVTTHSNDVIIVASDSNGVTVPTDTSSVTFYLRKAGSSIGAEFYGVWTSSGTITITCTTISHAGCVAFGISGADTSTIFDSNAGVPCEAASTTCSISTSNANDFLIGIAMVFDATGPTGCPFTLTSSFTRILCKSIGSGSTIINSVDTEYEVVSSSQSSLAITWGDSGLTKIDVIGDAICQSTCVTTVAEKVTITPYNSYSSSDTAAISGCSPSVGTIAMDGVQHTFTANPSCSITYTVTISGTAGYSFASNSTTWSYTTGSVGGTDTETRTVYRMYYNTLEVTANAQTNFDTGMSWSFTCSHSDTSGGTCVLPHSGTSGATATISYKYWTNYNQVITAPAASTSPPANSQWENAAGTTSTAGTPASGGNTYNTNYYKQWTNTFTIAANAQANFDSGMSALAITGTSLGSGATICSITITVASSDSCSGYSDNAQVATFAIALGSPPANSRWENAAGTSTNTASITSGSNTYTTQYWKQWSTAWTAAANARSTFDATMTSVVTGNQYGGSVTLCTITTTSGHATDTCSAYIDNNAAGTFATTMSSPPSNEQWKCATCVTGAVTSGATTPTINYYNQLQNSYTCNPSSPSTFDGVYACTATGTYLGMNPSMIGTVNTANGGGSVTISNVWADYSTAVSLPIGLGGWQVSGTHSWVDTTGGNSRTANYNLLSTTINPSISLSSAIARAFGIARPATMTITPVLNIIFRFYAALSSSLTLTSIINQAVGIALSSTTGLTSAISQAFGAASSTTMGLSSAINQGLGLISSSSMTITSVLSAVVGAYETLASTMSLSSTINQALGTISAASMSISASVLAVASFFASLTSSLSLTSAINQGLGLASSASMTLTSMLGTLLGFYAMLASTMSLTSAINQAFGIAFSSTASLSSAIGQRLGFVGSATTSLSSTINQGLGLAQSVSMTITPTLNIIFEFYATLASSLTLSSALNQELGIVLSSASNLSSVISQGLGAASSATMGLTPSVNQALEIIQSTSITLGVSLKTAVFIAYTEILAATITLSSAINQTLGIALSSASSLSSEIGQAIETAGSATMSLTPSVNQVLEIIQSTSTMLASAINQDLGIVQSASMALSSSLSAILYIAFSSLLSATMTLASSINQAIGITQLSSVTLVSAVNQALGVVQSSSIGLTPVILAIITAAYASVLNATMMLSATINQDVAGITNSITTALSSVLNQDISGIAQSVSIALSSTINQGLGITQSTSLTLTTTLQTVFFAAYAEMLSAAMTLSATINQAFGITQSNSMTLASTVNQDLGVTRFVLMTLLPGLSAMVVPAYVIILDATMTLSATINQAISGIANDVSIGLSSTLSQGISGILQSATMVLSSTLNQDIGIIMSSTMSLMVSLSAITMTIYSEILDATMGLTATINQDLAGITNSTLMSLWPGLNQGIGLTSSIFMTLSSALNQGIGMILPTAATLTATVNQGIGVVESSTISLLAQLSAIMPSVFSVLLSVVITLTPALNISSGILGTLLDMPPTGIVMLLLLALVVAFVIFRRRNNDELDWFESAQETT